MKRLVQVFLLCAPWAGAVAAAPADENVSDSALQVRGIFDASLPGTERKHALRLLFRPHLGDLQRRDTLRVPLGIRYGLTPNWEATGEIEGYISHGLGDVAAFADKGLSQVHLGTKYRLPVQLRGWDVAVGADYTHPLGSPPLEVTDGLEHTAPYISFARPLPSQPDMRVFLGLGADLINKTNITGRLEKNQLGDDTATLSAGWVWRRGPYHYTLEGAWTTTDGIGGPRQGNVLSLRPGLIWEVPPEFTFHSKGQWLAGVGLRITHGPDGTDIGASAKLRVNFDFKQLFGRRRSGAWQR